MPLWLCDKFSCINRCFSTYLPLRDYHSILLAIALQVFILSSNRAIPSHCPCSSIFYFFFSFPPSEALQHQFAKFHLNIQWIFFFFRIILDLGSWAHWHLKNIKSLNLRTKFAVHLFRCQFCTSWRFYMCLHWKSTYNAIINNNKAFVIAKVKGFFPHGFFNCLILVYRKQLIFVYGSLNWTLFLF